MIKKCVICLETKPITLFYKRVGAPDGYNNKCIVCFKKDVLTRSKNNPKRQAYMKKWNLENREYLNAYARERYQKNPEPKRQYSKNNREQINARQRIQRATNPQFKIATNLRRRINKLLEKQIKPGSPVKNLGCTLEFLLIYLEKQFHPNPITNEQMTWKNHSFYGWHIDHIKQLSSFDLTDPDQFLQACHYTNLQPLWAKKNLSKNKHKSFFI